MAYRPCRLRQNRVTTSCEIGSRPVCRHACPTQKPAELRSSSSASPTLQRGSERDWQERKEAYLAHLRTADEDVLGASLADKVHNARAILRDLRKPDIGEKNLVPLQSAQRKNALVLSWTRRLILRKTAGPVANELHEIVTLDLWRKRSRQRLCIGYHKAPRRGVIGGHRRVS